MLSMPDVRSDQRSDGKDTAASPLVSIIMPIYNTPLDHVQRALASITGQTYRNIEVIVVIDGCDRTYTDAVKRLSASDGRIDVQWIEHAGVSAARNRGLDLLTGDYVMFVDSDDEMVSGAVERALGIAQEFDLDLVCGAVLYITACSERASFEDSDDGALHLLSGEEIGDLARYYMSYETVRSSVPLARLPRGPWAKMYSKKILDGLEFDESLSLREDGIFNSFAAKNANRIGLVNEIWYYYHQNAYSVTKRLRLDRELVNHSRNVLKYCNGDPDVDNGIRAQLCTLFFEALSNESMQKNNGRYSRMRKTLHDSVYENAFADINLNAFDVSAKRRLSFWFCCKKWILPVYLYYSVRAIAQRMRGESAQ